MTTAGRQMAQKSVKVRKPTPTQRQRLAVKLAKANPNWTGKRILAAAGYRGYTLEQPGRVLSRPTAQVAEADHKATYRETVFARLDATAMANRHIDLALQDDERGVAARTLERIMEEVGVLEVRDQAKLTEAVLMVLLPIVVPHVPADRQSALLTDLEAVRSNRPVIDVTPEPIKAPQPVAVTVTPPTPPVVFQTNAQREDNH